MWLTGREIVEEEQQGEVKAAYGKRLIEELSGRLTERYGKGFSTTNLKYFRIFYLAFPDRSVEIGHPAGDELAIPRKRQREEDGFPKNFHPNLGWSHYRALRATAKQPGPRGRMGGSLSAGLLPSFLGPCSGYNTLRIPEKESQ